MGIFVLSTMPQFTQLYKRVPGSGGIVSELSLNSNFSENRVGVGMKCIVL